MLDDGGEVDLDLGNYERFLDTTLTRNNNITTGKVYNHVIQKEVTSLFSGGSGSFELTVLLPFSVAVTTWERLCR